LGEPDSVDEVEDAANRARFNKGEGEDFPADAMTLAQFYTICQNNGNADNTNPANYLVLAYDFKNLSVLSKWNANGRSCSPCSNYQAEKGLVWGQNQGCAGGKLREPLISCKDWW
jgi:hypothetical protein